MHAQHERPIFHIKHKEPVFLIELAMKWIDNLYA